MINESIEKENNLNKLFSAWIFHEEKDTTSARLAFRELLMKATVRTNEMFATCFSYETLPHFDLLTQVSYEDSKIKITTSEKTVIINLKCNGCWNVEQDVRTYSDQTLVLFIPQTYWENGKQNKEQMIEYKKLRNYLRHEKNAEKPFILLFWEDLLQLLENFDEKNLASTLRNVLEMTYH